MYRILVSRILKSYFAQDGMTLGIWIPIGRDHGEVQAPVF